MSTHTEQESPTIDAVEGTEQASAVEADTGRDTEVSGTDIGGTELEHLSESGGDLEPSAESRRSRRVSELEREGEVAADFLETLLDIADLDGDLEVDIEGDRAAVAIVDSEDGPAPRRLVGPGAAVLEALQELARLAVQAETGERSRLMLDVAGYRAERRTALVDQARRIAEQVKESGERAELEPMTAFERKVVHDEVLAAGLTSESEGEEPHRFVVVLPVS